MPYVDYPKLAEGFLLRPPPSTTEVPPPEDDPKPKDDGAAEGTEDGGGRDATASKLVEDRQLRLGLSDEESDLGAEKREEDLTRTTDNKSGGRNAANDNIDGPTPTTSDPRIDADRANPEQADKPVQQQAEQQKLEVPKSLVSINNQDPLLPGKTTSSDSEAQSERSSEARLEEAAKVAERREQETEQSSIGEMARREARLDTAEDLPRRHIEKGGADLDPDPSLDDDMEAGF